MNGGGKGKRAKRKWQSVKVVTQRVGPRREISFRQITTEAERMKALQTMRRVLYNYSTVFENYITFNLIELNNSDGLTENDFNYGFPECYTGAANNNRKIITPFITWLNNQNVKLENRALGVQARRLYDENGEPLFLPGHGENYPSPGNKNAYLLALDPPLDVLAGSEAPSIPINLMREGNKENMIKTLFPVAVTDAGGRAPLPSTFLYETNVNNIDLYIADVLEGNTMVRSRGFAASYIQKCRNQAKNIEFLRYLVNNRKENADGTGLQTTPAGAFKYNEPDSGWNQVTPWDDFIVRGGGINKQTRKRRNKKKKSRRHKKQRRRKTIKRRRKRGRKTRRKR